jgi:translation initiation factor 1A
MGRNEKGGKGYKKGKKSGNEPPIKQLILKEDGSEYATLGKNLGNSRFTCDCHDGRERLGHIRGKMQKRVWLKQGDLVLVSVRDYQDDKCDIVHKYNESDKSELLKMGQLIKEKLILAENGGNSNKAQENDEFGIEFSNEVQEEITFEDDDQDNESIDIDEI